MSIRRNTLRPLAALCAWSLTACAAGCRRQEVARPTVPAPPPVNTAEVLRRADEHYAARADLDRVREGLRVLRQIRAVDHDNYEAAWRASRLDYELGDKSTDDREREQAFADGIEAGGTAVKARPDRPEGHFWLGANYGGQAKLKGALYALPAAEKVRAEMEAVLRIDEGFQGGSAYLALGQLDLELPAVLGGDPARAAATLEKGLRFGETNALLRVRLAEAYLRLKRKSDARRELERVLAMRPNPDFLPEYEDAARQARELLAKNF